MIPGFDAAVVGMGEGEEKTVRVPPEQAYGQYSEENVVEIPTQELEAQLGGNVSVGTMLATPYGAQGKVIATDSNSTRIDFNHPLAGKTLVFKIYLRKIG